jgi:acyl-CoA thioesterase I
MPDCRHPRWTCAVAVALLLVASCSRDATSRHDVAAPAPAAAAGSAPAAPPAPRAPAPVEDSRLPRIVVLGDSLSAGLGLLAMQAYPALLQRKLDTDGYKWEVVNAGVSGDTSAAGLQRVDWALEQGQVRILILELGANDGLRGLPVEEMKKNLAGIIERAQARHVAVLLTGMEAPPNFGPEYTVSFRQVFRDLATQYKLPLVPFLLDKVAGVPGLNQGDGIHPNVEGAQIVADTVWSALRPIVDALNSAS